MGDGHRKQLCGVAGLGCRVCSRETHVLRGAGWGLILQVASVADFIPCNGEPLKMAVI